MAEHDSAMDWFSFHHEHLEVSGDNDFDIELIEERLPFLFVMLVVSSSLSFNWSSLILSVITILLDV